MGSDDFIDLNSSDDSEHQGDVSGHPESNSVPSEAEQGSSTNLEEIHDSNNLDAVGVNEEIVEDGQVQDMDLGSDSPQEQPIIQDSIKLVEAAVVVETAKENQPKASDNVCALTISDNTAKKCLIESSPITGVKRARTTYVDQQPCVRVVYNSLTRESRKKLMELMQQWSEWHARCKSSSTEVNSEDDALEYGEETYFPALNVGSEKTSAVSFWVDNQARKEDIKNIQLDHDSVPLYDRGYTLGSTSLGSSADSERMEALEASRCFNCSSYGHSLKECPKPRDNAAISNARRQHNSKRNVTPGSRGQVRYYQKSQGKYDDVKPGVLGSETRESLGIGELDPPPWLHRMRELGYPPGYLDFVDNEDQPSGITIFADEETEVEYEDGELPEKGEPIPPEKKMTVEFPGINAPIPENADHRRWATTSSSFRNRSHHRQTRILDAQKSQRSEGPPVTEYGSSQYNYSPRYSPYDHTNSPHSARSPSYGRSLSDRGWQSPHNPYPYSNPNPSSSHPYHSPSSSTDHWDNRTPFSSSSNLPSQSQVERQEYSYYPHDHRRPHRN